MRKIAISASCGLEADCDFVKCAECGERYHNECANEDEAVFDETLAWRCDQCQAGPSKTPAKVFGVISESGRMAEQPSRWASTARTTTPPMSEPLPVREPMSEPLPEREPLSQWARHEVRTEAARAGAATRADRSEGYATSAQLQLMQAKYEVMLDIMARVGAPRNASPCRQPHTCTTAYDSLDSHELSRSQVSARHAVARELPPFSGHSTDEQEPPKNRSCSCPCGEGCSKTTDCWMFWHMPYHQRWSYVRRNGLCKSCLKPHRGACREMKQCGRDGCAAKHHRALHSDRATTNNQMARGDTGPGPHERRNRPEAAVADHRPTNHHSTETAEVLVQAEVLAYLDEGSSVTLMDHQLLEELGLPGPSEPLCLTWTGGQTREEPRSVEADVKISGVDQEGQHLLSSVRTVESLSLPAQAVRLQQLAQRYDHLRRVPARSYQLSSPRLLIGIDNYRLSRPLRMVEGAPHEPVATKTLVGWVVSGFCDSRRDEGVTHSPAGHHALLYQRHDAEQRVDGTMRGCLTKTPSVLQSKVADQHSQRSLWRWSSNQSDPDECVMTRKSFGAACPPSCARFAKQFPRAVRAIVKEHFVDDMLSSVREINSVRRRYTNLVAHRVGDVLENSKPNEWRWVPTQLNVADEGTKSSKLGKHLSTSNWVSGPSFLRMPDHDWPPAQPAPETTAEERRENVAAHGERDPLYEVERFSRWWRLVRTATFVWRFIYNARTRTPRRSGPFQSSEVECAKKDVFVDMQRQAFPEEYRSHTLRAKDPTAGPEMSAKSVLHQRSPYLDDDRIIRLKRRIDACAYVAPYATRPIILPKLGKVTDLRVDHYHRRYHHAYHQTIMNVLRQRFDVPALSSACHRVRQASYCKIRDAKPQPPPMGNVPAGRVSPYSRPFSFVGIDLFGLYLAAIGRRLENSRGVLFTCMKTRADHAEEAHATMTIACSQVIRNFVGRRWTSNEISSDQGSNLVGANRELKEAGTNVSKDDLIKGSGLPYTPWHLIPPSAPHFGGACVRLVQTVKRKLETIQRTSRPPDAELQNWLIEVESVVHSRPLTDVPVDRAEGGPLTPNHFLLDFSPGVQPLTLLDDSPTVLRNSWTASQKYADAFWKKWVASYLPTLTRRSKWHHPARPLQ